MPARTDPQATICQAWEARPSVEPDVCPVLRDFFFVGELKQLVMPAAKGHFRSVQWRTTLWPIPHLPDLPVPWGGFIVLAVHLADKQSGGER